MSSDQVVLNVFELCFDECEIWVGRWQVEYFLSFDVMLLVDEFDDFVLLVGYGDQVFTVVSCGSH